jgi:sulfate adenylyltransferase subunit 2
VKSSSEIIKALENESIEILRETAAVFRKPVLLYSIGKDSAVLLHLTMKAFWPAPIPFPVLHIDTTWKFKEMISFRDEIARIYNVNLITHTNSQGIAENITPFNTPISEYTRVMITLALRQALDAGILVIKDQNFGAHIILRLQMNKQCVYFQFRIGLS